MSDEPTERDVEALADLFRRAGFFPLAAARAVLASDWYAERIAQARREGAVEALEQAAAAGPSSTATDQLWRMWLDRRRHALRDDE